MIVNGKLVARAVALVVTLSAAAGAQEKCGIDENKVGKELLQLQLASQQKDPAAKAKAFQSAVKAITAKTDNAPERDFLLAQALAAQMSNPATAGTAVRRADLGFVTDPEKTVDVAVLVDSLFRSAERVRPNCEAQFTSARRVEAWAKMVNDAVQAYNAEKIDEAVALATRSNLLYSGAPFSWNVLAGIAQRRNQPDSAIVYLKNMAKAAQNDTSWAEMTRNAYGAIGQIALDAATNDTTQKARYLAEAKAAFQALAKDPGTTGNYADIAKTGLARIALAEGDVGSIKSSYSAQLANPTSFTYQQLLEAGTTAARAEQFQDAITLLQAAQLKNPWNRDVINNLAVMYIRADQSAKALPFVQRLVQIDPNNPDNFQLLTLAYAGQQKFFSQLSRDVGKRANATTNARLKKALIDSAAALSDSIKRTTDLALRNNAIHDTMSVKVSFTNFGAAEDGKTTLGGTIENRGKTDKSYTMVVDFIDEKGQVVATQTATVGPVKPQSTGKFSVSATGANIAGFRYKPLS